MVIPTAEHENGVTEVPNVAHNTTSNHDSPGSNTVDHNESNVTDDHPDDLHNDDVHSLKEELAHACHKASISCEINNNKSLKKYLYKCDAIPLQLV
jgi:hypothetical protein